MESDIKNRVTGDHGWTEPESAANTNYQPLYPFNQIWQTESGHSFEMDDTPTRERVRLQHRSGTFIEMHPDGDEVHKVYGDGYEITIKNKLVLVKGFCNITIEGDSIVHVKGNKTELIDGDYDLMVKGKITQSSKGKTYILSDDDMTIGAKPDTLGTLNISTGSHVQLTGDLNVSGHIAADIITAETRIDTGEKGGIRAGLLGFVSTGGLSIGLPGLVAVPGTILCGSIICTLPATPPGIMGTIVAGTNIKAPFTEFGQMTAISMFDIVNTAIYNTHLHPSPKGMTGPTPSGFLSA